MRKVKGWLADHLPGIYLPETARQYRTVDTHTIVLAVLVTMWAGLLVGLMLPGCLNPASASGLPYEANTWTTTPSVTPSAIPTVATPTLTPIRIPTETPRATITQAGQAPAGTDGTNPFDKCQYVSFLYEVVSERWTVTLNCTVLPVRGLTN